MGAKIPPESDSSQPKHASVPQGAIRIFLFDITDLGAANALRWFLRKGEK